MEHRKAVHFGLNEKDIDASDFGYKPRQNEVTVDIGLDNDNTNTQSDIYNFLKVYCDFGYFICYIPFRLVKDSGQNFRLSTNWLQQIFCAVAQAMVLFRYGSKLRSVNLEHIHQNSIIYFDLFGHVATVMYQAFFVKMLWTKRERILDVVIYLENSPKLPKGYNKVYFLALAICSGYGLLIIAHSFFGHEIIHSSDWTMTFLSRCYIEEAKYMYFLKPKESCDSWLNFTMEDVYPSSTSTQDLFLGLTFFIMQFYRYFAAFYIDLSILMCSLTLWFPAKSFARYVQTHPNDMIGPLEQYNSLKLLSSKINLAIGSLVIVYFLEGILYYSSHLDSVIVVTDWFDKFRVSMFLFTLATILTVSGRSCKVVEEAMHTWINFEDNSSKIHPQRLVILLNDLNQHVVGISGNGLFTISFTLVINMCSVVVTYFIITLGFK